MIAFFENLRWDEPAVLLAGLLLAGTAPALWFLQKRHRHLYHLIREVKCLHQALEERLDKEGPERLDALEDKLRKAFLATLARVEEGAARPRFSALKGEDLIFAEYFAGKEPGVFVEVGAGNGLTDSMTLFLEDTGWNGILVEPHPEMAEACGKNRPRSVVRQVALSGEGESEAEFTCTDNGGRGALLSYLKADADHLARCHKSECAFRRMKVNVSSLNEVLAIMGGIVDVISISVSGMEPGVLKGLDLTRYAPKMIAVEGTGSSHTAVEIRNHLASRGYGKAAEKGSKSFFVPLAELDTARRILHRWKENAAK